MRLTKATRRVSQATRAIATGAVLVFCPLVATLPAQAQAWQVDGMIWATNGTVTVDGIPETSFTGEYSGGIKASSSITDFRAKSQNPNNSMPSAGGGYTYTRSATVEFSNFSVDGPCYVDVTRSAKVIRTLSNADGSGELAISGSVCGPGDSTTLGAMNYSYIIPATPLPPDPGNISNMIVQKDGLSDPNHAHITYTLKAKAHGLRSSSSGSWEVTAKQTIAFAFN
jgi:hypothetical protein